MRGLYKREGSPFWFIRYADKNGRIRRASSGTTEKKLAKAILDKRKTEVVENKHLDIKRLPNVGFHELCDQYWEIRGKNMRAHGIKYILDIWKKYFGNVPISEISQQRIERYLTDHTETRGWSVASRNVYLIRLKALFTKAVEWKMLESSPAKPVEFLRGQEARTRFLTAAEIEKLLDGASKRFRPLLTLALHTGMRKGEIFRLRWPDIDFQARIITVNVTKSGKRRSIPMDETLVETLRTLPSRFKQGVVFPSQTTGEALTDVSKIFPLLCDKVGLKDIHFHDLRHTFASHLVMSGVDIRTVQELLGHATMSMTMRYSHLAPEHRAKAVHFLDSAYNTNTAAPASRTGSAGNFDRGSGGRAGATDTTTDTLATASEQATTKPLESAV